MLLLKYSWPESTKFRAVFCFVHNSNVVDGDAGGRGDRGGWGRGRHPTASTSSTILS